jgi:hypothetical protein
MMTNQRLYIAIGIPCFTMLVTLLGSIWQSTNVLNQLSLRITSLETQMKQRMGLLEQDMKLIVRVVNELDNRLSRLEERLAR